jgi:hypothetical protein
MPKPGSIPRWATNNVVDGTSGINNKVAPTSGQQDSGFVPLNVKPSRQHINWLLNLTGLWITYFDGVIDQDVRANASPAFTTLTVNNIIRNGGNIVIQTLSSGNISIIASDNFNQTVGGTALQDITGATSKVRVNGGAGKRQVQAELEMLDSLSAATATIDNETGNINTPGTIDAADKITAGSDFEISSGTFTNDASADDIRGSSTDIDGNELETLSSGAASDASALHTHETVEAAETHKASAEVNTTNFNAASPKRLSLRVSLKAALPNTTERSIVDSVSILNDNTKVVTLIATVFNSGSGVKYNFHVGFRMPTVVSQYSYVEAESWVADIGIAHLIVEGAGDYVAISDAGVAISIKRIASDDYRLFLYNASGAPLSINSEVQIELIAGN